LHYYNFNIADYRADTAHLSLIEHGIYRQLIDWYYLDEKPIPKETQVVMRRLRLGSDELHYLENVLQDFFLKTDTGYFHSRIEQELEHYRTQFAKNRVNGQLGGRPKKPVNTPLKTQVVLDDNHMATQTEPKITLTNNQEPITNNQEPLSIEDRGVTPTGRICKKIAEIGIIDINQSNPTFLTLIESGASDDEFVYAARTAKKNGKGFNYILAIVKNAREEAKKLDLHQGELTKPMKGHGVISDADFKNWLNDDGKVLVNG
jgi:uncharacterized protein YdaU (DUF1376 family)